MPEANGFLQSAGKWWRTNPKAENLKICQQDTTSSYLVVSNLIGLKCYAKGDYTYVQEGMPIWPEYDDTTMARELEPEPGIPVQVGIDFGLTPAAIFAQRMQMEYGTFYMNL